MAAGVTTDPLREAEERIRIAQEKLFRFRVEHKIFFDAASLSFKYLGQTFEEIPRVYQRHAELTANLDEAGRLFQLALNRRCYQEQEVMS